MRVTRSIASRRVGHVIERNLLVYKHGWLMLLSGMAEPFLYLLAMGFGIGSLVGKVDGVSYAAYIAPALMASSAMNGALFESTFNLFFKLNYAKLYDTMLATPIGTRDIAAGEIIWALIRGTLYATCFLLVMALFRLVASPLAMLMVPAAVLVGFAFGAAAMAATTWMRTWQDFDLVQLVITPLFLFSGTFFPISAYPAPLQLAVQLTPLYHAVDLIRGLALGQVGPAQPLDVLYLLLMGAVGVAILGRRLDRLLLK